MAFASARIPSARARQTSPRSRRPSLNGLRSSVDALPLRVLPATCPFCACPESRVLWANEHVFAIHDGFPVSPGHTLIIPRRHVETWFDASAEEHVAILHGIAAVKRILDAGPQVPDGYNVGFNAGRAAGQTVMHLHVHVIPRFEGDMGDPRGGVRGVIPSMQKYGGGGEDPFANIAPFTPGQEGPLLPALQAAIRHAAEIDIVAAFVQLSGLDVVEGNLLDALDRGARVRLLTGDYLGITHPHALQRLYSLTTRLSGLEVRLYRTAGDEAFHPKAYIFSAGRHGLAFVGSSNLSRSALTSGVEWNVSTTRADQTTFHAIRERFGQLFGSRRAAVLTPEVLADYQRRVRVPPAPEPGAPPVTPHDIQREVLEALAETRQLEETRGLVVLATGLGKTLLAAFDFAAMAGRRALFVAHREEILTQAAANWARALPDRSIGFLTGERKEPDADLLFASVATLAQRQHLHGFAPDHFDYIIIDEFHHAAATSYRKLLDHFQPRFLLGLTATPDRMDGARLLDLCDGNEVARVGLFEGITRGFLSPFRYHGVADELDYTDIPWRSGRFDTEALTALQATRERAGQALREYLRHAPPPRRSLIFCCSRVHADFTAAFFREQGVEAVAVHSGPTSAPRAESVRRLQAGELEAIVTVDLFNEGFDVPDVDTILMLRPTESPIIFLQQLGRGLRRSAGKAALRVVDFIGNHRGFLVKPRALFALTGEDVPGYQALYRLRDGDIRLPPGCTIDVSTEALDLLDDVVRVTPADAVVHAYQRLRDGHGRRPSARELLQENGTLRPIEQRHRTWFDFVATMGDLAADEQRVLDAHRSWFADLAGTQMARSYKMVALEVLDDTDALHGTISVRELSERCRERMRRDPQLRGELAEHDRAGGGLDDFVRRWRVMPLRIFHDARGFSEQWFELDDDLFCSRLRVDVADRETFDRMTSEIVEYRLADYTARSGGEVSEATAEAPIELAVSHSGGKPILRFDRIRTPGVPEGDTLVEVDGGELLFRFKRIAVNVVTERRGGQNVLAERMRAWFGPKAGLPGTRHRVELRRSAEGRWALVPRRAGAEGGVARLPFYELAVACGSPAVGHEAASSRLVDVTVSQPVDPKRHFLVEATGHSMDGGPAPIRDGDLVLCEWVVAGAPEEFQGHAVLVTGATTDEVIAAIKIPVLRDGEWALRSTNPRFPDLRLEPGVEMRIVAKVVGVL